MKFTDIIALAKQGFTPADIREFMKLDTEPEEKPAADPDPEEKPAADSDPEEKPAADPDPEEKPAADPDPDYKALYEEEKAKRQALSRKQEVAADDNKSNEVLLLDIAKMYI